MKTLIINPPCEFGLDRNGRWPAKVVGGTIVEPLFLAYSAAVLEQKRLEVELIDCPPLGLSRDDLLKRIDNRVGLAVFQISAPSMEIDMRTCESVKDKFPEIKIALVGPHASVLDRDILEKYSFIDYIVRGEYDYTISELASFGDPSLVLGITFRENGLVMRNQTRPYIEDLDQLPFPARHFLPMERYFEPVFKSRKTFRLFGSRGCPFRCTFCLWPQTMFGRRVRLRNPRKIVDEIEYLINNYGAKGVYFEDDTFTVVPNHVAGVCDEIIRRKIKIPWSCLGRVDNITEEMIGKMKKAGCVTIRYGVESSSQEILDRLKKGIRVDQVVNAFKITKKYGIESYADYVMGLPGETKETLEDTIEFAKNLNSDFAQFSVAVPYPGTELYQEAKEKGWLKANNNTAENPVLNYPYLSDKEIKYYSKKAYRSFYFRPGYIFKKALSIKSFKELSVSVKGAFNLFKSLYLR